MHDPTKEERIAIEQFLFKATVPVLYDWGEKGIDQIGTGTLFTVANRHFFITSRHIFKSSSLYEYDPAKLAYPETPFGITPYPFGNCVMHLPDLEALDVAILELIEPETVERLKTGWHFLSAKNATAPTYDGWFILCGYPSKLLKPHAGNLRATLVSAYTTRMAEIPSDASPPPDPRIDMFFYYGGDAISIDGSTIKRPPLPGMSGASVWHLKDLPPSAVWTPECCRRVMGVQSAWREDQYFRAINWLGVVEIFRRIDGEIAVEIESAIIARAA